MWHQSARQYLVYTDYENYVSAMCGVCQKMTLIDWILSIGLFWAIYRCHRLMHHIEYLNNKIQRLDEDLRG